MIGALNGVARPVSPLAGPRLGLERASAIAGLIGLIGLSLVWLVPEHGLAMAEAGDRDPPGSSTGKTASELAGAIAGGPRAAMAREYRAGAYGGVSFTHPSTVAIVNPGRTDMSVRDFAWLGRPFKSPIYYGLRAISWSGTTPFGGMLDFTHAKAIARFEDDASFTGTLNGKPLPDKAKLRTVFKHLEFSHGHNMVTLNGLVRLGQPAPRLRPYVGLGAGVSIPHTEIGLRSEPGRTYEYQFAGLVGQAVAGVEIPLGATSVFFEYKFSYAPYNVPLSGVVNGSLLVSDVWRQIRAWYAGAVPVGGRLRTTLATHHGIAGVLVRVGPHIPGAR